MAASLKLLDRLGQAGTLVTDAQKTVPAKTRQGTEPSSKNSTDAIPEPAPMMSAPVVQPAKSSGSRGKKLWLFGVAVIVLLILLGLGTFVAISQFLQPTAGDEEALALLEDLPSSQGMVRIEGNVYTVGLTTSDKEHAPIRQVELTEFWLDQREVTNAQFAAFLAQTDNQPLADWPSGGVAEAEENQPVKGVTWDMAAAYCSWARKRLPTEAEWEVAARGAEGRLFPWGDNPRAVQLPRSGTYAVGTKTTNQSPFGVFDMAGNVWEWVGESYAPVPEGQKVLRGGSNDFLKDMAYRLQGDPNVPTMYASAGLRCAADQVNVPVDQSLEANVLYEDSFDDPGSGWPILSEGIFFFGYHPPDFYHIEVGTVDRYTAVSRQPEFDNVTVEAEVLVDHTDTEAGDFRYGLALRRSGEDQFYAFTISYRTGSWAVLKSSPLGLEVLNQGKVDSLQGFAPVGFAPDKTDLLRVDANGPEFIFHINHEPVARLSDPDYVSGEVGFFVENFEESLAHVHFDALTIRETDAEPVEITSNVLYADDFSDPASGWPEEDEAGAPYRVGYHPPDFYHLEPRAAEERLAISLVNEYGDVTVETDAFIDHTDTDGGDFRYGLLLRRVAEDQYYAFTISPRSGTWQVLKSSPTGLEILQQGAADTLQGFAPAGFTPDKSDRLRVDADGPDFTFSINGQRVTQVTDEDYTRGEVGFYAENFDESLTHAHYGSLVIKEVAVTPVQPARSLLLDDFTDPASGWPEEDEAGVPYRVGYHPPDFYHVEPRDAAERIAISLVDEYGDVTVETDAFIDHTDTDDGVYRYGLVLRRTAEDQYYAFTITPRSGTWQVLKSSPTELEILAEGSVDTLRGFAPAGFTPDKSDKLRVVAYGSDFVFFINDEPIIQVSDSDYSKGEVGFYAENFDETLTHVHFESLLIREADEAPLALAPTVTPEPPPATPTPGPDPTSIPEPTLELEPEDTATQVAPDDMVLVPAGHFLMGSSSGQLVERPEHPVFLDAFYVDQFEVTNAQYRECVRDRSCTQGGANSNTRQGYRDDLVYDDYPVINVTWDQANAYCVWAGKHLPSEAQWEYAASGSENLTWPWGSTFDVEKTAAGESDTQPVGSYPDGASVFGVYDLAGNVNEWVADEFSEDYYAESPPSNPLSLDVSAGRLYRGGSFGTRDGSFYTSSYRFGNIRTFSDTDLGFRCALDASEATPAEERALLVADFCELYAEYKPDALCP
jgi:formylglycine-generating enzyme required for sulfatase activity